jgi:hypothetical protein
MRYRLRPVGEFGVLAPQGASLRMVEKTSTRIADCATTGMSGGTEQRRRPNTTVGRVTQRTTFAGG